MEILSDVRRTKTILLTCHPGDGTRYEMQITRYGEGNVSVSTQFNGPIVMSIGGCVEYVKRMQEAGYYYPMPECYNDFRIDYIRSHSRTGDVNPWTAIAMAKAVAELYLMGELL